MIVGLGVDIVETARIAKIFERYGMTFSKKILHPHEFVLLHNEKKPLLTPQAHSFLASRFAVKEAAVKALGTGFSDGISFIDIEVISLPSGQPTLVFHGKALQQIQKLAVTHTHITLSHGKETSVAVVILEQLF